MKYLFAFILTFLSYQAFAQSTAQQTIPGINTTVSCPNGSSSCFKQFSTTNPLSVAVIGTSGATSGYVYTSNGPGAAATFQASSGGNPNVSNATGTLPVANGGTGQTYKAYHDFFSNSSIFPTLYPNPPTVSWTGPGGSSPLNPAFSTGYQGQQFSAPVSVAVSSGNVLTFPAAYAVNQLVQQGMAVTHLISTSETNAIPAGTVVTATTSTTITLSNNVNGTIAVNDGIGFGVQIVNFQGFIPLLVSQYGSNYWGNGGNAQYTREPFAVEFETNSNKFTAIYRDLVGNPNFWVFVDGQPITSTLVPVSGITPGAGSLYRMVINFNNPNDNVQRMRRVKIFYSAADFGGFEFSPTDIFSPPRIVTPKVSWDSDSYCEGVTGTGLGLNTVTTLPQETSFLLGFGAPLVDCQGGTGYTNNGGGANGKETFIAADRLAVLLAYKPNLHIFWGSINDDSSTPAAIQTAAATAIQYMQSNLPNTKVIVVGVQSRGNFDGPNDYANDAALKAAANAAGVTFIDPLNEGWIIGAGRSGSVTGYGNADLFLGPDGVHLQQAGIDYEARRLAGNIVNNY